MKRLLLVLLAPTVCFADCTVVDVLPQIRPGAQWSISGSDTTSLIWISTDSTKPTSQEIQAAIADCPNQVNLKQRTDALNDLLSSSEGRDKFIRAEALVLIDELNLLREWDMNFQAMVAAATSLADLKTRVATLPALPDRTPAQAKTAIQNKVNSGTSD